MNAPSPKSPRAHAKTLARAPIDLDAPDARRRLAVQYPTVMRTEICRADADTVTWIDRYEQAREAERIAGVAKERAAAHVCAAIGVSAGVATDKTKATWLEQEGHVDWQGLCNELGIDAETVERFRRPPVRVLRVAPLSGGERGPR